MRRITRTQSGQLIIPGLDDIDIIQKEYARYTSLLDEQLCNPRTKYALRMPVDVRFVIDEDKMMDPPRTGWIWCPPEVAATIMFGNRTPDSMNRMTRLLYEGHWRNLRVNQWIVRTSRYCAPPAYRGWALFRRYVNVMRIYDYWARETYKPNAVSRKRRRHEFENMETIETRYVGL